MPAQWTAHRGDGRGHAVMAYAPHTVVVEHLAHVVGVDAVHHERHRPTAVHGLVGPTIRIPGIDEGVERPRQLLLVAGDRLHPHGFEVAYRGCETDRLGHHGDPGLETLWRVGVGRPSMVTVAIIEPPVSTGGIGGSSRRP